MADQQHLRASVLVREGDVLRPVATIDRTIEVTYIDASPRPDGLVDKAISEPGYALTELWGVEVGDRSVHSELIYPICVGGQSERTVLGAVLLDSLSKAVTSL